MLTTPIQNLFYKSVTEAARDHGNLTESDHEVGDLQNVLEELVNFVPDEILKKILVDKDSTANEILVDWLDIDEIKETLADLETV